MTRAPRDDEKTAVHASEPPHADRDRGLTPGQVVGGRYRIVAPVGRGGMGEVYRADDLRVGHPVALKFLTHREHAARVWDEVRVGREIAHPNVCRLYDAAEADGRVFITMEFIDGEDLASLLRRVGRLTSEKALAVARDVCAGLAAAHEKGIVHRDLKPANVMIDGSGRARVTDFGLAVAGRDVADRSGTPAYMAPEQLAGEPASAASDLYAFGLVVYEIFTGRRPFEAGSTLALLALQQAADFRRPSSVTSAMPPAVERVIVACLQPDPRERPRSAAEILRELPGGDPLAAAVAAGETPSPGMVAAAARVGDLRPVPAWGLLLLALGGLVANAVLSERTLLRGVAGLKSPDVLRERAREVLERAGLGDAPRDSNLFVRLEPFSGGRLGVVYRESPLPIRPRNALGSLLSFDPPLDAGMANVNLDADGRLRRFIVAPPVTEEAARTDVSPEWGPFLEAAGYDPASLAPATPEWPAAIVGQGRATTAFVDSDQKRAWIARDGSRIEAASYRGRPVFFSIITAEVTGAASSRFAPPPYLPERIANVSYVAFLIALPAAGLLLARANLRRGRGDRAGAFRVAGFMFVVVLVGLTFQAHHSMRLADEWTVILWHVATATFIALMVAMMYLALEPFVRRRWPEMLISWMRLLAGRLSDPMVGRDVLAGAAGAAVAVLLWQATHLVVDQSVFFTAPNSLGPARFVVFAFASTIVEAVGGGVGIVILLVLLRAVIPHDSGASVLTILFVAMTLLGDTYGPFWLRAFYAVGASVIGVLLARRFGMLAVIACAFFLLVQQRLPLTLDPDAWYFGRSAVILLLAAALIARAFRVALGARRWLPRLELEPAP